MGNTIIYSQSKPHSIANSTTSDGHFIPVCFMWFALL